MQKETQVSLINKLKKEVIPGINLFETILFSITTVIGMILFLISVIGTGNNEWKVITSNTLMLIDIPLGILAATFLSKRSKIAPLLLFIDALLYGIVNLLNSHYVLGIVNTIIIPGIFLIAYFTIWSKSKLKEVETKKLTIKTGSIILLSIILISMMFGFILPVIFDSINNTYETEWLNKYNIWFDSFAATLMIFATISSVLRYRETWIIYMISNIMKIILFTMLLIMGEGADGLLLLLSLAYLFNTIFGLFVWSK